MAGAIIPIVYGKRPGSQHNAALYLHAGGTLAGGAVMGAVVGALGHTLSLDFKTDPVPWLLVGCLLHGLYGLGDMSLVRAPRPESCWQVPRDWIGRWGLHRAALAFGLALGPGLLTRVASGSYYVVLYWLLCIGSPVFGAVVMSAFAVGRVAPFLALSSAASDGDEFAGVLDMTLRWRILAALANGIALLASGAWLATFASR